MGKGENAGDQHFLPFPAMFSTHSEKYYYYFFKLIVFLSSENTFHMDQPKNLSFGKELQEFFGSGGGGADGLLLAMN